MKVRCLSAVQTLAVSYNTKDKVDHVTQTCSSDLAYLWISLFLLSFVRISQNLVVLLGFSRQSYEPP